MGIGERIKEARQRAGMTQAELADAVGRKQNSVTDWENNRYEPRRATVDKIAAALGVAPGWLEKGGKAGADVVDLFRNDAPVELEPTQLALVLQSVMCRIIPPSRVDRMKDAAFREAAEAAAGNYKAMARITRRLGAERVREAVQPVLANLLESHGQEPLDPPDLEYYAQGAAVSYMTIARLDRAYRDRAS